MEEKKIVFCKTEIIWGGIIIKKYKRYNLDNELISTLERIKRDLEGPFPSDVEKLEDDYNEFCSAEDFYEFFMLIVGSLSYVLADKKLPKRQLNSLSRSFFELYPRYSQMNGILENYPALKRELELHERARRLLINIISN
ncbi:YxiJ family protein [Bacillus mexicanus]